MTTHIDQLAYGKGYRYQVREADCACTSKIRLDKDIVTKWYRINRDGTIIARVGYAWNGANKPAINTKSFVRASLFHDIICQAIKEGLLDPKWRAEGDRLMHRITKIDGMIRPRRWWTFKGVFGWGKLTAKRSYGRGLKTYYIPKEKPDYR